MVSYNLLDNEFSTTMARRSAEQTGAKELAETIRTVLTGIFLKEKG